MMSGVGASLPAASSSPDRAVAALFADEVANQRTALFADEVEAADRHAETAVPASPPEEFEVFTLGAQRTQQFPATLEALMAQMAGMTALLENMANQVKALEAYVTPGSDPWRPGLAAGRPAAPPGVEATHAAASSPPAGREPAAGDARAETLGVAPLQPIHPKDVSKPEKYGGSTD